MSVNLISENQNRTSKDTPEDPLGEILSFLGPEDLRNTEEVCRNWNECVRLTYQWKRQCQNMLGLSVETDLKEYIPECSSYKDFFNMIFRRIHAKDVYRRYIGEIGPVPQIPKTISLKRWDERDRCEPTEQIGSQYIWVLRPSHIEISVPGNSPLCLDGLDDPTNPNAPRLIERTPREKEGLLIRLAKKALPALKLKVPVTINNIEMLFKRPKIGNPSQYFCPLGKIIEQCGNRRITPGWACIRKGVIGRDRSFRQQLDLAHEKRVVPSDLVTRILANCLEHVRSGEANVYLDREKQTFARTSTLIRDSEGNDSSSGCGAAGSYGLSIGCTSFDHSPITGLAVELPIEVQSTEVHAMDIDP